MNEVNKGTTVRTADGEKLGRVSSVGQESFLVVKGIFFPREYVVRFGTIAEQRGDEIWLNATRDELDRGLDAQLGSTDIARASAGMTDTSRMAEGGDVRVQLTEEELRARTSREEVGRVGIHKDVITEERTVNVPVTHEEVRVERVPVADRPATAGEATFERTDIEIPLHEEKVHVEKQPVVKEELRVSKEQVGGEKKITETIRKETAAIKKEGDIRRSDRGGSERRP